MQGEVRPPAARSGARSAERARPCRGRGRKERQRRAPWGAPLLHASLALSSFACAPTVATSSIDAAPQTPQLAPSIDTARSTTNDDVAVPVPTASANPSATAGATARSLVPAYVFGGAAIASAIVGAALLATWSDKRGEARRTANSILADGNSCVAGAGNFDARCASVESMTRTSTSLKYGGVGTLIGAGALATGAGALVYWTLSRTPIPGAVSVAQVASKDGAALLITGSW